MTSEFTMSESDNRTLGVLSGDGQPQPRASLTSTGTMASAKTGISVAEVAQSWTESEIVKKFTNQTVHWTNSWSSNRIRLAKLISTSAFAAVINICIIANTCTVVYETDVAADGGKIPLWLGWVLRGFLVVYTLELAVKMYVFRSTFFRDGSHLLDIVIVSVDIVCELVSEFVDTLPSISILRIFRVLRLLRVLRAVKVLRELHFMLHGMMATMKAMFWATILLIFILTGWSIVAVELVHPLNRDIAATGVYSDCERCPRAFASVFEANLTFVQQIVAGDSWGLVSLPIIERHPWTGIILMGALLSVNLGIMNLVLSVIVDTAVEARAADVQCQLNEKKAAFRKAAAKLLKMCQDLDVDNDGHLTLAELTDGFYSNPEFAATLTLMDIYQDDLALMFKLMDVDKSGEISYTEFVEQLFRIKERDSHTTLMFLRFQVRDVEEKFGAFENQITSSIAAHGAVLSRIAGALDQKEQLPSGNEHPSADPREMRKQAAPVAPPVLMERAVPSGGSGGTASKSAWSAGVRHVQQCGRADLTAVLKEAVAKSMPPLSALPASLCSPRHQNAARPAQDNPQLGSQASGRCPRTSPIKGSVGARAVDALDPDMSAVAGTATPRIRRGSQWLRDASDPTVPKDTGGRASSKSADVSEEPFV